MHNKTDNSTLNIKKYTNVKIVKVIGETLINKYLNAIKSNDIKYIYENSKIIQTFFTKKINTFEPEEINDNTIIELIQLNNLISTDNEIIAVFTLGITNIINKEKSKE